MNWQPSNSVRELITEFVSNLITTTPEILGISEIIPGCTVMNVPAGATPKVVTVSVHEFHQRVMWRGVPPGLAIGDVVAVAHLREGNVYEIIGASGAGGSSGAWDAQFLTLAAHAQLDNERVFTPGTWVAGTDGGAGGAYTLDFEPDKPVVVSGGAATEYANIQAAITAASACDTVLIPPGTYAEDITLKANVCVKGLGPRDKIRITGDEYIVTTAQDGWLENVTIVETDPTAGGYKGAIHIVHNGVCNVRHVSLLVTSTVNVTSACGVSSANDGGTGWLYIEDVIVRVTSTVAAAPAVGMMVDDDYNIYVNRFYIECAGTGGAITLGLAVLGDGIITGTHGDIVISGAVTPYDLYVSGIVTGSIQIYSVKHDSTATTGLITHLDGDRAGKWRNELITGTWTHSASILGSGAPNLGSTVDAEKWGSLYLALGKDAYLDGEEHANAGVFARFVNRRGIGTYVHHARVAWGVAATLVPAGCYNAQHASYNGSFRGTFMAIYPGHATLPTFWPCLTADPIAANKQMEGRFLVTGGCEIGLRANNYDSDRVYVNGDRVYAFDMYLYAVSGSATFDILSRYAWTQFNGAVWSAWTYVNVSTATGAGITGEAAVIRLLTNLAPASSRCYGYVVGESGAATAVGNAFLYDDAGITQYPARRLGVFARLQGAPYANWDWYDVF